MIQTLSNLGAGFDCASKGEIEQVMSFGVTPESIIFANPTKFISHIKYANEKNVDMITVDNNFELEKMSKYYPTARYEKCQSKHQTVKIYSLQLSIPKFGATYSLRLPDRKAFIWS